VAREFGVARRTIRRLYERFDEQGQEGISPHYDHCGLQQPRQAAADLLRKAEKLRREHPSWGAPLIRVILAREYRPERLPSSRTLQRWFAKHSLVPAPPGQRPNVAAEHATRAHEVWQMDASELIKLRHGGQVSWLRITDELTSAVLQTTVFAQAHFNQVAATAVQHDLRHAFTTWGKPRKFRVDNGTPWGSKGDFPTDLALWLIGLDIDVVWNPPRRPDKNAVVERSQGVGKQWTEPSNCRTRAELQRRLNEMDHIQREEYPAIDGVSRWEAYPELKHSGRRYELAWEEKHWNWKKVVEHLSGYVVGRRVDRAGLVSIYNRGYYVGKHYRGQPIQVFLDPTTLHWVFADRQGRELRTHCAEQITRERIVSLQVTHRRPRKPK
jgi:hypothetical protein